MGLFGCAVVPLNVLLDLGYKVQAIIIDGKRGLYKAFKDYPIQMCHFHQRKTINKYLTRKPKLQASKDLQKIMYNLTTTNQKNFTKKLDEWYKNIIIHNTTNSIDGGVFSPMKKLLKIHNGFTKSLKLKMVDDYLVSYKKK